MNYFIAVQGTQKEDGDGHEREPRPYYEGAKGTGPTDFHRSRHRSSERNLRKSASICGSVFFAFFVPFCGYPVLFFYLGASGCEDTVRLCLRMLRLDYKSWPARIAASERMKLDHPIQDLWLKSGKIMQSRRDGLILPYMETPTVTIVERGQVSDPDADGLVRYPFKLNTSPHFVWCELFGKHRHVPVRIREKVLFLVCRPDVMKEKYALVKDAIISTNQDYEEEKRQLIPLLQNKSDTGANADDAVQQRREQIQKDFESLEL